MALNLNVSIGEAIDKLTILDIKKDKIKDKRLNDVLIEFNYLNTELEFFLNKYKYYYNILKDVNLQIWELQDLVRENKNNENYTKILDDVLNLNDIRFIVKKKINEISKSTLNEQKGYKLRICYFITDFNKKNYYILNGAIRYLSFLYDEVKLIVNCEISDYVKNMFSDDPFINIINEENIDKNYDLFVSGYNKNNYIKKISHSYLLNKHNKNSKNSENSEIKHETDILIYNLYNDIYLDNIICKKYFKYNDNIIFAVEELSNL